MLGRSAHQRPQSAADQGADKAARVEPERDSDAMRIRAVASRTAAGESPKKGGILAALRRSPLVAADLEIGRPVAHGRKVVL